MPTRVLDLNLEQFPPELPDMTGYQAGLLLYRWGNVPVGQVRLPVVNGRMSFPELQAAIFKPENFPGWWKLPLWWLVFTVFVAAITGLFMLIAKKGLRREFGITLFFQNGLFFPLAILTGMHGSDSEYVVYLFFFMIFFPSLFFSTSHFFFGGHIKKFDWAKIFIAVVRICFFRCSAGSREVAMVSPLFK